MNCGELADVSDANIRRIAEEVAEKNPELAWDHEASRISAATEMADVNAFCRICVAATGGHMCVEDKFYFDTCAPTP